MEKVISQCVPLLLPGRGLLWKFDWQWGVWGGHTGSRNWREIKPTEIWGLEGGENRLDLNLSASEALWVSSQVGSTFAGGISDAEVACCWAKDGWMNWCWIAFFVERKAVLIGWEAERERAAEGGIGLDSEADAFWANEEDGAMWRCKLCVWCSMGFKREGQFLEGRENKKRFAQDRYGSAVQVPE